MTGNATGMPPLSITPRLTALDQVGHVLVAGIESRPGVHDADHWPVERVVGVAERLYEGLAQEHRERGIAILGEGCAACRSDRSVPDWMDCSWSAC